MKRLFLYILPAILLAACSGEQAEPVHVSKVYKFIENFKTTPDDERLSEYLADSVAINAFMKTVSEPPVSTESLTAWADSKAVEVFSPAVDSIYPDVTQFESQLGNILARAKKEGLDFPERQYAAVVYGKMQSVLFVDSVMLIALNHYLGADYKGYFLWPEFIRQNKTPEAMPYDIAEALTGMSYPYKGGTTLLSRMLYEGALAHAKMLLVPKATVEGVLGYDAETLNWLNENESEIWRGIVAGKYLYDTSVSTIDRFVAPAPKVSLITPEAPGRVGRFIGYKIVSAYIRQHPEVSITELLSPDFYASPKTLADSRYNNL